MPTSRSSSTIRAARCRRSRSRWVLQRLADLEADGETGIERGHRLLEDHRDVLARDLAPVLRATSSCRSWPSKAMTSASILAVNGSSPITASIATDLPEPDSPTIASTSSRSTATSTPSTALKAPWRVAKETREIADFEQGHGQLRRIFGIERVAQAVAGQVDRDDGDQDREAGQRDDPGIGADEFAGIGEHRAPFRRRRLRAEAEKAEARRLQDGVGDAERGLHDQRREAIGQHGREHQPDRPDAGDARGGDVILGEFAERRGAHQPDIAREIDDRDRDDRVGEARARGSRRRGWRARGSAPP